MWRMLGYSMCAREKATVSHARTPINFPPAVGSHWQPVAHRLPTRPGWDYTSTDTYSHISSLVTYEATKAHTFPGLFLWWINPSLAPSICSSHLRRFLEFSKDMFMKWRDNSDWGEDKDCDCRLTPNLVERGAYNLVTRKSLKKIGNIKVYGSINWREP